MLLSIAVVTTDAPARYAKQLLSHLGNKVRTEPLPDQPEPAGRLLFAYGVGTVLPAAGTLVLRATAANLESLARVQDVMQRHLERFGARKELVVTWGPVDTTDDSTEDAVADITPENDVADNTTEDNDAVSETSNDANLLDTGQSDGTPTDQPTARSAQPAGGS